MLYSYLEAQNDLTQLRIKLPALVKVVQAIEEENVRLQYEIDSFENPQNLMHLALHSQYSHLHHPTVNEILILPRGVAIARHVREGKPDYKLDLYAPVVIGSK